MSAWVVEKEHIDVMLRFGIGDHRGLLSWRDADGEWRKLDFTNADEIGAMLMEENVASVCARYEDDTAEMYEDALGYMFTNPHYTMTPQEALKAVACYEYQACEHDGWEDSEAKRFCEALSAYAAGELMTGPWGWDADALRNAKLGSAAATREP